MFTFAIKRKESMKKETVKYDCSHFEGHIPCKPNKQFDVQCDDCSHYDASKSSLIFLDTTKAFLQEIFKICNFTQQDVLDNVTEKLSIKQVQATRILFIKLGAIGDVIRTTPLLTKYKKEHGNCHFSWITHSPQVVPKDEVDVIEGESETPVAVFQMNATG